MRRQLAARTVAKGVDAVGLTKPAFRLRERVRARRAGDGAEHRRRRAAAALAAADDPRGRPRRRRRLPGPRPGLCRDGATASSRSRDSGPGCDRLDAGLRLRLRAGSCASGPAWTASGWSAPTTAAELVDWCRENLPFAEVRRNGAAPPLPAGDSEFSLIYAFSVFTHLGETAQRAWMRELERVSRARWVAALHHQGRRPRPAPARRASVVPVSLR